MTNDDNVKTWALVKNDSGLVSNLVLWDEEAQVGFDNDVTAVEMKGENSANIGYSYKDGTFIAPEPDSAN